MIRRSFRIGLWLGLIAGIAVAVAKLVQARHAHEPADVGRSVEPPPRPWPRLDEPAPAPVAAAPIAAAPIAAQPEPVVPAAPAVPVEPEAGPLSPVAKKATAAKKPAVKKQVATWVDPKGNICPKTHPVKAKLSSKIFQVPGMFAYDRTNPDRCYKDPAAAENDGFRAAKR